MSQTHLKKKYIKLPKSWKVGIVQNKNEVFTKNVKFSGERNIKSYMYIDLLSLIMETNIIK